MKQRKIILAPAINHPHIMSDLLKNNTVLENVLVLPFNTYINDLFESEHPVALFTKAYARIVAHKDRYPTLHASLTYPQIIQALVSFYKECLLLDIDINQLPDTHPKDVEIKTLLGELAQVYEHSPALNTIKNEIKDASHVDIYPFFKSYTDKGLVECLESKGAKSINYPSFEVSKKQVYYALNQGQEAEAIAQWLLAHPNQKTLVVTANQELLPPLLVSALERYNLDYSIDYAIGKPLLVYNFLTLLDFLKTKSMTSLITGLTSYVFNHENYHDLARYIQVRDLSYEQLLTPFELYQANYDYQILDARDINNLKNLEMKAEAQRQIIIEILQTQSSDDYHFAYDILATSLERYPENQSILLQIKEVIEHVFFVSDDPTIQNVCIEYFLENLSDHQPHKRKSIHITNLNHGHQVGFDTMIVCGANQQNFPNFVKASGIIDEAYLEKCPYPSLEERLKYHLNQLDYVFHNAPHIIYSYASANFEGKTLSESLELTKNIKKEAWPLKTFGQIPIKDYHLNPEIAQSLFFRDDTLYGSVSSFEVFFQCHYRYFLQYGLRLSVNDGQPTIVALMGSIAHAIVEDLKDYSLNDPSLSGFSLHERIHHYFKDLYQIYPHQSAHWSFVEARFYDELTLAINRLLQFEADSDFKFYQSEHDFMEEWPLSLDKKLALRGFVDRIDTRFDYSRIIDYKSSSHNLSLPKVKAGLQLQLLTYALVIDHTLSQDVLGVHYFSFLNEVVDVMHSKISRNQIIEHSLDEFEIMFLKKHKLSGWFFKQDASMYHSDTFIKNITSTNKVSKNGYYDLGAIKDFLYTIYDGMAQTLAQGNIERNPIRGACQYCDFRYICVFKGNYRTIKDLAPEIDIQGGNKDA